MSDERELWSLVEPVHAIVYFEPTVSGCLADLGLHGFWNGYFAGRAAALGAVGPEPVTALFFGFAPPMVAKAVPKVWGRVSPDQAIAARLEAVSTMLTPLLAKDPELRRATDVLVEAAHAAPTDGRALAAAWQGVDEPSDPAARLWWAATVLREQRGDGHVLAATLAGLNGLETMLTHVASGTVTREIMQPNRGWTDEEWDAAQAGLVARGLIATDGSLTEIGSTVRAEIEADTDWLARSAYEVVASELHAVAPALHALGDAIVTAGALPAGNPMGLTR